MNFCKKKVLSFLKQKTPSDRVGWGTLPNGKQENACCINFTDIQPGCTRGRRFCKMSDGNFPLPTK